MAEKLTKTKIEQDSVLIGARVSEKALIGADKSGVYVFNVTQDANKRSITLAVKKAYKVTPVDVRLARTPDKQVFVRGKRGVRRGGKKAYVVLKKGEKIEII